MDVTEMATAGRASKRRRITTSLSFALGLALLHGYLASIYIDHPPFVDEIYHMLAAESWRDLGQMHILDGEYHRAALFTKLIAAGGGFCGFSLECARWVSVVASGLLVLIVTFSVGVLMSPAVGFLTGTLLALNPALIVVAHWVRFYTLFAFLFFLFALAVYVLIEALDKKRVFLGLSLGAIAIPLFWLANHLQPLAKIGFLGVMVGVALISSPKVLGLVRRFGAIGGASLLVAGAAFIFLIWMVLDVSGELGRLRSSPEWALGQGTWYLYYHHMLYRWYPALWPIAGLLSLLSILKWPRLSLYSLAIFVVGIVFLSVAGQKADRYVVFVLPFLFIPMAAGLALLVGMVVAWGSEKGRVFWPGVRRGVLLRGVGAVVVVLALTPFIVSQPVVLGAARMVTEADYVDLYGNYAKYSDWAVAAEVLRGLAGDYPLVVSSSGVKAAFYLGDFSFLLNHSAWEMNRAADGMAVDFRTGREILGSAAALREVLHHCGPAVVIVEENHHSRELFVSPELVQVLNELGTEVAMGGNLRVYTIAADVAESWGEGSAPEYGWDARCRLVTRVIRR